MANPQFYIVQYEDGSTGEIPISEAVTPEPSFYQFRGGEAPSATVAKYASNLLQGASLGFGDELAGLAATGLGKLGFNYPSDYQTNVDFYRKILEGTKEEAPVTSFASQLVGGIPSAFAVGPSIPAQAALGAVTGAGETNDNRLLGALFGAAFGTIGAKIGGQSGKTYQKGAEFLPALATEPVERAGQMGAFNPLAKGGYLSPAEKYMAQDLARRGLTADDLARASANQLEALGEGQGVQTFAEAFNNKAIEGFAQAQAQGAASRDIAAEVLAARSKAIPGRLDEILDLISPERSPLEAGMMARQGVSELEREGLKRLSQASEVPYNQLNWEGTPPNALNPMRLVLDETPFEQLNLKGVPGEEIQSLLETPLGKKVTRQALETTPGGVPEQLNLREVKKVASALGKIGRMKANAQIQPSEIITVGNAEKLGKQLDQALYSQVPGLRDVDALYPQMKQEAFGGMGEMAQGILEQVARSSDERIATEPGRYILGAAPETIEEVVTGINKMGLPQAQEALRAGVRGQIQEGIAKKEGMGAIRDILKKGERQRDIIEKLTGAEVADLIEKKVGREISFKNFENAALGQSATARFTEEANRLNKGLSSLLSFVQSPKKSLEDAAKKMLDNWVDDAVKKDITRILYSQGLDAVEKMKRLRPYLKELEKVQARAQQIANTGRITGAQAGSMFGSKLTSEDF